MTLILSMLLFTSAGGEGRPNDSKTLPESVREALVKLRSRFEYEEGAAIVVDVSTQRLYLVENNRTVVVYSISTSKYGVGNRANSNKTPQGTHRIKSKHGDGAALGTVFKARVNTGKIALMHSAETDLDEDAITTRILWLEGLEAGKNKGKGIDSYHRYIYIHGTPEEGLIGKPASHGCVRMKNEDVVELFEKVPVGTLVEIAK